METFPNQNLPSEELGILLVRIASAREDRIDPLVYEKLQTPRVEISLLQNELLKVPDVEDLKSTAGIRMEFSDGDNAFYLSLRGRDLKESKNLLQFIKLPEMNALFWGLDFAHDPNAELVIPLNEFRRLDVGRGTIQEMKLGNSSAQLLVVGNDGQRYKLDRKIWEKTLPSAIKNSVFDYFRVSKKAGKIRFDLLTAY